MIDSWNTLNTWCLIFFYYVDNLLFRYKHINATMFVSWFYVTSMNRTWCKSCGRSQMHGFSFSRDSTTFSVIVVIVYIVIVVALLFHIVFARWQSFVWPLDWHSRPRKTNERVRINFVVKQWKTGIWICPLGQNLNKGGGEW